MVNGDVDITKFPDKGMPNKYTNVSKRWVVTTSSKSVKGTSNTATSTLTIILLLFQDD